MTDVQGNLTDLSENGNLVAAVEALLFVASGPVSSSQLAEVLGKNNAEVNNALKQLNERLESQRGLSLQWHKNRVQLTSSSEYGKLIENFLGLEASSRLSRAALETLSIIAYKQPATRPQLDSIRGVNSDGVIKSLLSKGLIEEIGRAEGPGRPIMYGTTPEFLQHFGINSLDELPPLEILEEKPADPLDLDK
ncbi:MAG: SMC-Scp complex subunit ScpB [Anaerolineaceae bacterium]